MVSEVNLVGQRYSHYKQKDSQLASLEIEMS
jgi:hypothetical protein